MNEVVEVDLPVLITVPHHQRLECGVTHGITCIKQNVYFIKFILGLEMSGFFFIYMEKLSDIFARY